MLGDSSASLETADLLRKHGGKTGVEIAAERRAQGLPFP